MNKSKQDNLERPIRDAVRWHNKMLIWALNRCEHTPYDLVILIRDKSNELTHEHDPKEEKR